MGEYNVSVNITTHAGGVAKKAVVKFQVDADSMEEAVIRMRSAAARIVSKPEVLRAGDGITVETPAGGKYITRKMDNGDKILGLSFGAQSFNMEFGNPVHGVGVVDLEVAQALLDTTLEETENKV